MRRTAALLLCAVLAACAGDAGGDAAPAGAHSQGPHVAADGNGVHVEMAVTPAAPTLTDPITLTLTVTSDPAVPVTMPAFTDRLGDFTVSGYHVPPEETRDGRVVRRQEYKVVPGAAGAQFLPPLPVGVTDAKGTATVLATDPLEVEVGTLGGDAAPSLGDLAPAEGAVPLTNPTDSRWMIAGGAGALVALLAVILWWRRRRRATPAAPVLSPRELAAREFAALRAADPLGRGDVKGWYVELTAIVRRYIERADGIRAPELTTPEFLRALQEAAQIGMDRRRSLEAFLEAADLVKFAAHRPGREDIDQSEHHARELVGLAEGAA